MIACMGGSIHACCYEVGDEIVREAERLGLGFAVERREEGMFLNNVAIAKKQLKEKGILETKTETMPVCSGCRSDLLFSYRKEEQTTGRFAGVIFLR